MSNKDPNSGKGSFGKKNIIFMIIGIVIAVTGFSVWEYPHLNIHKLVDSIFHLINYGKVLFAFLKMEVVRLIADPFAILGILLMGGGTMMIYEGITYR